MNMLRQFAERYLLTPNERNLRSLKQKMDRTQQAAEIATMRYLTNSGETRDTYEEHVLAQVKAIVSAGRRARGLPPCKIIDRYGRVID